MWWLGHYNFHAEIVSQYSLSSIKIKTTSHVIANLLMPYANMKDEDEPAHPRILINYFAIRCLYSILSI